MATMPKVTLHVRYASKGCSPFVLLALVQSAHTRRLVLHRRAYYRSLAAVRRPAPPTWAHRGTYTQAGRRLDSVRTVARVWASSHYAPARAAFLAELAALCNKHRFEIVVAEYDGPPVAMPRKRSAKPFTARTVLPEDY